LKSTFLPYYQGHDCMKNFAISIIFCILSITVHSFAIKLDLASHTSLIDKLESASRLNSKDSMVLHNNLAHRLADLYAERARLLAMDQEGKGAQIHEKQINSDRRKAIAIHSKVVKTLKKSERGSILIQIAHMHELLDEN